MKKKLTPPLWYFKSKTAEINAPEDYISPQVNGHTVFVHVLAAPIFTDLKELSFPVKRRK